MQKVDSPVARAVEVDRQRAKKGSVRRDSLCFAPFFFCGAVSWLEPPLRKSGPVSSSLRVKAFILEIAESGSF